VRAAGEAPTSFAAAAAAAVAVACVLAFASASREANAQAAAGRQPGTVHQSDNGLLSGFRFRSIGPAVMGGRVDDIEVAPSDPNVIYVGFATAGVYKSVNNGTTFAPIFERYGSASIGDIAVHPRNPDIVYVGTGEANNRNSSSYGDGIYKSVDGGRSFVNIGLEETQTIARIVIDPRDPEVVYVAAPGHLYGPNEERGLYKSTDGGAHWTRIKYVDEYTGFTEVVLDPSDSRIIYAASYQRVRRGCCYNGGGPGSALWKSTDAGASWTKLTRGLPPGPYGRITIDVSRADPNVVYAQVEAGESVLLLPGSGSGADSLRELRPLPNAVGEYWTSAGGDAAKYWCDNGVANPRIGAGGPGSTPPGVLPVLDPTQGGVFRSDDGGTTWTATSNCNERPLYFSQLRVDPHDANTVYASGGVLTKSVDGGKTFVKIDIEHSDSHALWIDPANPKHLINGNDGGINISYDGGAKWDFVSSLPTSQAYSVTADMERPYHVFVGLQDNGSWRGPSSKRGRNGIRNADWFKLPCVGDGYVTAVDPGAPHIVYCEGQDGAIRRVDLAAGSSKSIRPYSGPYVQGPPAACDDGRAANNPRLLTRGGRRTVVNASPGDVYRFNWNTPFILSPHDPDVVLLGGNRLFRSPDRGESWVASADLTKQIDRCKTITMGVRGDQPQLGKNDGIEWYGTITSVAESPVKQGVIWAGTDDGKLQVSRDGGRSFTDVSAKLPGLPRDHDYYISGIDASHFDAATAYVAVDGHRSDDMRPYVFVTRDYGATFRPIMNGLPAFGNVLVVREDPKNPELLFAGTEFGLFVTLDGGARWDRFMNGMPTVRVDDLLIHPRDGDLIAGTHGLGVWIADDISALQQLTGDVVESDVHLFQPREVVAWITDLSNASPVYGTRDFSGENAPAGGAISYYLASAASEEVLITVSDSGGRVVASASGDRGAGIHKLQWSQFKAGESGSGKAAAPTLAPGIYTVRLAVGAASQSRTLQVLADRWFRAP
jgi:photosystem II stability/assembly factor-like uncharacterized protein